MGGGTKPYIIYSSISWNSGYNYDDVCLNSETNELTLLKTYAYSQNASWEDDNISASIRGTSSHAYRTYTVKKSCIYNLINIQTNTITTTELQTGDSVQVDPVNFAQFLFE